MELVRVFHLLTVHKTRVYALPVPVLDLEVAHRPCGGVARPAKRPELVETHPYAILEPVRLHDASTDKLLATEVAKVLAHVRVREEPRQVPARHSDGDWGYRTRTSFVHRNSPCTAAHMHAQMQVIRRSPNPMLSRDLRSSSDVSYGHDGDIVVADVRAVWAQTSVTGPFIPTCLSDVASATATMENGSRA